MLFGTSAIAPAHLVLYAVLDALMFFEPHRLAIAFASHGARTLSNGTLCDLLTAVQLRRATKVRRDGLNAAHISEVTARARVRDPTLM